MQAKRDVIVDSALRLFKQQGINSTGVAAISDAANTSKKTLYKYFSSKEELVLAALRKDDEIGRNALLNYIQRAQGEPIEKILSIFDFYHGWFNSPTFTGCMFTNSAAEIADTHEPSRRVCAEHKLIIAEYIEKLLRKAGVLEPVEKAKQLNLLLEGAIVYAFVIKDKNSAITAKSMAELILKQATPRSAQH